MKNLLPLLVIACLFTPSCEKEALQSSIPLTHTLSITQKPSSGYPKASVGSVVEFALINERLVLKNAEDFSTLMWAIEDKPIGSWEKQLGFKSLSMLSKAENFQEELIIQRILNKDGIIQINPWIFKLDFQTEEVYVLPAQHKDQMASLNQHPISNTNIKIFSFEDDVWSLLKEDKELASYDEFPKKCKEARSKNKRVSLTSASCICTLYYWQNTTIGIRYSRFGIWETVRASYFNNIYSVYGQSNNQYTPANLHGGTIHYHFDERCGITYYGTKLLPPGQFSQMTYLLRSDKKPLERNKSIVNMTVQTSYIINPPEPIQDLNIKLKDF